jgi:hypothetical protein
LEAGTGLPDKTYQMLVRWDDPNDPGQYLYSGAGAVPVEAFINCDDGFTYGVGDFFALADPDIEITTPTPTPTPTPAPTPPIVAANGAAGASGMCDDMEFRLPIDATTFSDSCYGTYESPRNYQRYTWSFTRVDVVESQAVASASSCKGPTARRAYGLSKPPSEKPYLGSVHCLTDARAAPPYPQVINRGPSG